MKPSEVTFSLTKTVKPSLPLLSANAGECKSLEEDLVLYEDKSDLLRILKLELEGMRVKGFPAYIDKISEPYVPTYQLNDQQRMVHSGEIKTDDLIVLIDVSLSPKSPIVRFPLYKHGLLATLLFDKSYVNDFNLPPEVWFRTRMSHPLVSHSLELQRWAYFFGKWFIHVYPNKREKVKLHSVVECLHSFLFSKLKNVKLRQLPKAYQLQLRSDAIIDTYISKRVHKTLFQTPWPDDYFNPEFLKHFRDGTIKDIVREIYPDVFTFPIFSKKFCLALSEEMENYNKCGLPISRPNSMNNYGLIINDIGLEPAIKWFQEEYIWNMAKTLFSYTKVTSRMDDHHSFIVHYQPGKDLGLDMHTDDSDITFNVCLGKEFEGAALNFCGVVGQKDHRQFKTAYHHVMGSAVMHLGYQRHGACNITSGERLNLIIWNRNKIWKMSQDYQDHLSPKAYSKEEGPPDARCLSYTHDKDYLFFKKKLPDDVDKEKIKIMGWCPPEHAWYDEFADARKQYGIK